MSAETNARLKAARPVCVALLHDHPIVEAGLSAMLAPHRTRVTVVDLSPGAPRPTSVDVVLFDTFGRDSAAIALVQLVYRDAKVIHFTWAPPEHMTGPGDLRSASYLWKGANAEEVVRVVETVHHDESVMRSADLGDLPRGVHGQAGLSRREAEVLHLIAQGLSNQEVGEQLFLGINSVKTYIRAAYHKIGVERRSQAVLWVLQNSSGKSTSPLVPPSPSMLGAGPGPSPCGVGWPTSAATVAIRQEPR